MTARTKISTRICIVWALIQLASAPVEAKDLITWGRAHFPPFAILKGEYLGGGVSDYAAKVIQRQLTEYEHENLEADIPRIMNEIKAGNHWCWVGALKNAEREVFSAYSLPYGMLLPQKIIIRKERMGDFVGKSTDVVQLEALFQDQKLRTATLRGRSYNPAVNALLARNPAIPAYSSVAEGLKMLMADRLDFVLEYPEVARFNASELGKPDDLISLPFKEMPGLLYAYAICPKNEWGKKVIDAVNLALTKERPTPAYRAILERWNDEESVRLIRRHYDIFLNDK